VAANEQPNIPATFFGSFFDANQFVSSLFFFKIPCETLQYFVTGSHDDNADG